MNAPLAIIEKRRMSNDDNSEVMNVIGDVRGRIALTFDDEVTTGGSMISAIKTVQDEGAQEVYACVTHPVLSGNGGAERVQQSPKGVGGCRYGASLRREAQRQDHGPLGGPPSGRGHQAHT